ncbi:MAG: tyrosine--tRNA ligase [Erysipelotrichaceae bacterium]|jgi:tyrosyl-tRNA synthetase|nr:tyrosine--tRNA ligase [Erysipelotrichaceae bacterium]
MNFFDELNWRGLIKDCTDVEGLKERLKTPVTCYCGIDPTADSLHIGHLQQVLLLRRYQQAGHRVIALCGGATGMIGDPRPTTERSLISLEDVAHNVECIKKQLSSILDFSDDKALLLNNHDWLGNITMLHFLRDYGKYFSVSYMIAKDTIASRLDTGISFTEFTYTILQAADWLHLYQNYDCELQIGGSDQWGNLVSGNDLIRKVCGDKAKVYGITSPLITKSDGSKFGKSEGENIWLDPNKTSPYQFYQFIINIADEDIINMLQKLSFKTKEEIEELEIEVKERPHLRKAQKALAEELTLLVHGQEALDSALKITETLFKGNIKDLSPKEIKDGLKDAKTFKVEIGNNLVDEMVKTKIVSSKREARQLISSGSISLNGDKMMDLNKVISIEDSIDNEFIILRKGKKNYFILNLK